MHPMLEEYFEKLNAGAAAASEAEKKELLLKLGLYEKEYLPEGMNSTDELITESDPVTHETLYYRKKPIEITDAEYAELLRRSRREEERKGSGVAKAFKIMALIIFALGGLGGFILGADSETVLMLTAWLSAFAAGLCMLGFGEIIELLTDIKHK